MATVEALATRVWLLFLLSLILSALAFPAILVSSYAYSWLSRRFDRTPKILLMALVTFLAIFAALVFLEVYVGYTLADVAGALSPSG